MNTATTESDPQKSAFRNNAELPNHPSSAPRSPQTPSLPDARPRSDRIRCGGRESKFLAFLVGGWFTLLATALAQGPTDPNEGAQLTPGSGSGNYTFSWYARTQNLYYLKWSTDMVDWHYFPYVLVNGPAPFTAVTVPAGATFVFGGFSQTLGSLSIGAGATVVFTSGSSGPFSYRFQMAGPSLYVRAELGPITAPADADGDGIFDYQEILSSLDPTAPPIPTRTACQMTGSGFGSET